MTLHGMDMTAVHLIERSNDPDCTYDPPEICVVTSDDPQVIAAQIEQLETDDDSSKLIPEPKQSTSDTSVRQAMQNAESWLHDPIGLDSSDWRSEFKDYREVLEAIESGQNERCKAWLRKNADKVKVGDQTPDWFTERLQKLIYAFQEIAAENPKAPKALYGVQHEFIFTTPPSLIKCASAEDHQYRMHLRRNRH